VIRTPRTSAVAAIPNEPPVHGAQADHNEGDKVPCLITHLVSSQVIGPAPFSTFHSIWAATLNWATTPAARLCVKYLLLLIVRSPALILTVRRQFIHYTYET
jgi:hypothetical protein